jgi:hypothetical protein
LLTERHETVGLGGVHCGELGHALEKAGTGERMTEREREEEDKGEGRADGAALSPRRRAATAAGITSPGSMEGALPGNCLRKTVTWRSWAGPRWASARREGEERWAGFRSRRGKKQATISYFSFLFLKPYCIALNCM